MGLVAHFKMMADYHRWAHEILLRHIKPISNDEYRHECGLYFQSVHGTLNHLLLGDMLWHGRFVGRPVAITGLDHEFHSSREALMAALTSQAACWVDYVAQLTEARCKEVLSYQSSKGIQYALPTGQLLGHVFNHGTHHRGQVSAIITQLGYPCPEMDLVYYMLDRDKG